MSVAVGSQPITEIASSSELEPVRTAIELMSRIDQEIEDSCVWLRRTVKISEGRTGWSLGEGYQWEGIVPWGGTIDAGRALFAANRHLLEVRKAAQDLLAMRHPDGGWGLHYSNDTSWVAPTAWAVVLLTEVEEGVPEDAIRFLLKAQHTASGAWGNRHGESPRLYPTLVAAWALANTGHGSAADRGLQWLLAQEQESGAWCLERINASEPIPSVALTSQIVYVLQRIQSRFLTAKVRDRVVEWLAANALKGGLQEEVEYYKIKDASLTANPHTRHFSTAWAILALEAAGCSPLQVPRFLELARLLVTGQNQGAWRVPPDGSFVRTYFVAHGLLALLAIRQCFQDRIWAGIADGMGRSMDELRQCTLQLKDQLQKVNARVSENEAVIIRINDAIVRAERRRHEVGVRVVFVAGICMVEGALIACVLPSARWIAQVISPPRAGSGTVAHSTVAFILIVAAQVPVQWLSIKAGGRVLGIEGWRPFQVWGKLQKALIVGIVAILFSVVANWITHGVFSW